MTEICEANLSQFPKKGMVIKMNWIEVNIYTTTFGIDILCSALMDLGIKGFAIKDAEDFNEFLENKEGKWDYIDDDLMGLSNCESCVTVYIADNSQGAELLVSLKSTLRSMAEADTEKKLGRLEAELSNIREEDWANNWKQYFKPFTIGEKLLIKPSWENCDNADKRVILEIDPASSFGTGQHNTTRLCLEYLEDMISGGERLLDLGCGSGILSIAAILLGAKSAMAVDIEENSVATAVENAEKNNIDSDKYTAYCGNVINDTALCDKIGEEYDIITANIVADVLIAMKNIFVKKLKKNGVLIVSGIIDERKDEVVSHLTEVGFTVIDVKEKDGWAAVKLTQ